MKRYYPYSVACKLKRNVNEKEDNFPAQMGGDVVCFFSEQLIVKLSTLTRLFGVFVL